MPLPCLMRKVAESRAGSTGLRPFVSRVSERFANADIRRQPAKSHPAPLAAHRFNHTFLGLMMNDLHQVIPKNLISTGNLINCDQPILMQTRIDQNAQGIVGEMGKTHRKSKFQVRSTPVISPRNCRPSDRSDLWSCELER